VDKIKTKTTPQYIFDYNLINPKPLPTNLRDQQPQQIYFIKWDLIYDRFKKSINATTNLNQISEDNIPDGDIDKLRNMLKDFNKKKNFPNVR